MNKFVSLSDEKMPYPRVCAHRGLSALLPENSLISFGAALATGVHEIELDVWATADGRLVVCHDPNLERIAINQAGVIRNLEYNEVMRADIGSKTSLLLKGLQIAAFEDVLALNANRAVINLHIKSPEPEKDYNRETFRKIIETIDNYESRNHVYLSGAKGVLKVALEEAPDIARNCLERKESPDIVDNAIKYKCKKLQFLQNYSKEAIEKAHQNGIICNFCCTDEQETAHNLYELGIDTILTNNCWLILGVYEQLTIRS